MESKVAVHIPVRHPPEVQAAAARVQVLDSTQAEAAERERGSEDTHTRLCLCTCERVHLQMQEVGVGMGTNVRVDADENASSNVVHALGLSITSGVYVCVFLRRTPGRLHVPVRTSGQPSCASETLRKLPAELSPSF